MMIISITNIVIDSCVTVASIGTDNGVLQQSKEYRQGATVRSYTVHVHVRHAPVSFQAAPLLPRVRPVLYTGRVDAVLKPIS